MDHRTVICQDFRISIRLSITLPYLLQNLSSQIPSGVDARLNVSRVPTATLNGHQRRSHSQRSTTRLQAANKFSGTSRRSLNSNHHLVEFIPMLVGVRVVMPSAQRAKSALIVGCPLSQLASSQMPTDPKASLPSQCHPTTPPRTT